MCYPLKASDRKIRRFEMEFKKNRSSRIKIVQPLYHARHHAAGAWMRVVTRQGAGVARAVVALVRRRDQVALVADGECPRVT
jgi:hypothetical protein